MIEYMLRTNIIFLILIVSASISCYSQDTLCPFESVDLKDQDTVLITKTYVEDMGRCADTVYLIDNQEIIREWYKLIRVDFGDPALYSKTPLCRVNLYVNGKRVKRFSYYCEEQTNITELDYCFKKYRLIKEKIEDRHLFDNKLLYLYSNDILVLEPYVSQSFSRIKYFIKI